MDATPLPELELPASFPANATLVVLGRNDISIWGQARVGRRRVARLSWSSEGTLLYAMPLDSKGRGHGVEMERHDEGHVVWTARWVHGVMHGPVIQFDTAGTPIMVTHFDQGRGFDIWIDCGQVSEVRELADGVPHGFVRWGDPERPWEEEYFVRGRRHGVRRRWTLSGRLKPGFPEYYIADEKVSAEAYEAARVTDPSLREYRKSEDSRRRKPLAVVRDALLRAQHLAAELELVRHAETTLFRRAPGRWSKRAGNTAEARDEGRDG